MLAGEGKKRSGICLLFFAGIIMLPLPGWSASGPTGFSDKFRPQLAQATPSAPPTTPPQQPAEPQGQAEQEQAAKEGKEDGEKDEEDEPEVTRVPLVSVELGGVLLQPDQLVIEPALGYSFSTNTRLIVSGFSVLPLIILGSLESEKTKLQTFTQSLGFRYGLRRGLQMDIRVPYVLQTATRLRVSTETAGQVEEDSQDFGLGDVNFGLSYQFLYEKGWVPDMVVRLGATAPTGKSQFDIFEDIAAGGSLASVEEFLNRLNSQGSALGSGRWFIDVSLTAVKALDPAVLFGTLGYSYAPGVTQTLIQITSIQQEGGVTLLPQAIQADIGPVNTINQSLGLAISLNNRLSMNFSFANLVRFSTNVNGQKIPDSNLNVTNFNVGLNIALTPQVTANISGTIGLTPDAPDWAFAMAIPFSISDAIGRWFKDAVPGPDAPGPATPSADQHSMMGRTQTGR